MIESLETRRLLSAGPSVVLTGGVLVVNGTNKNDVLTVAEFQALPIFTATMRSRTRRSGNWTASSGTAPR